MKWWRRTIGSLASFGAFVGTLPLGLIRALQALIVLASVLLIALPQLQSSFDASRRYAGVTEADMESVNNAIEVARCTHKTGLWLVRTCENGRLVPFGMDDPGQPLLLGLVARLAHRDATVMDAARLNLIINTVGLTILAITLLSLGAFTTAVMLLALGPYVFLEWYGPSHHWALLGTASTMVVLPLALISRARHWPSPAVWRTLLVVGLLCLAFAALLREVVASMGLLVTICAAAWTMRHVTPDRRRLARTLAIIVVAVLASQSSRLVATARDWAYSLDSSQLPATHGMSHTLYIGLGGVENKFGIKYLDAVGADAAAAAVPGTVYGTSEYFRVIRGLYFQKWREDPQEVVRIYVEKLKLLLADRVLASAPPLGVMILLIVAIQWMTSRRRQAAGDPKADARLAINLVALAFVGLFAAQAMLATPSLLYNLPLGPFILLLGGIAIENLSAWIWRMMKIASSRPA
jgi:hypothetical protein